MSAAEEAGDAVAERPTEEVAVAEKKRKAPKERKPKMAKAGPHPPYFEMIKEALLALNEKGGSSPYAIAKYMEEKHKAVLPANFRKILGLQLKNSAAKGKLVKVRASYKLSESGKKGEEGRTKPAAKNPRETRRTAAKASAAPKKSETLKKTAKMIAPKKSKKSSATKPKQLKSIKSPAAKKAKKATA